MDIFHFTFNHDDDIRCSEEKKTWEGLDSLNCTKGIFIIIVVISCVLISIIIVDIIFVIFILLLLFSLFFFIDDSS